MTTYQLLAWLEAGQTLVAAGVATVASIKAWIQARHPDLSDADLNAILDRIAAGAATHKHLAEGDASAG